MYNFGTPSWSFWEHAWSRPNHLETGTTEPNMCVVCVHGLQSCLVVFVLSCVCVGICVSVSVSVSVSVFRSFRQGVLGAEQLYQVKRMQRNVVRVVSIYSQSLMGKIQWLFWWTSGASDNSASTTSLLGDERWTQHWVKVSPLIRNHRGRWFRFIPSVLRNISVEV